MKTRPKAYGTQQRRFQEGVCSDSVIPQEAREALDRQPNSVSREARERGTNKQTKKKNPKSAEGRRS